MQLPYLGKSRYTKNDEFSLKQHVVMWINNVKQCFIYTYVLSIQVYLSDRLITSLCARTHALSRCLHWLTAESMKVCCRSSHTSTRRCFSLSTLLTRHIHAVSRLPKSCSRRGSDLDCLAARGQDRWCPVSLAAAAGWCPCAGALQACCWKTNVSPCLIAGSICWDRKTSGNTGRSPSSQSINISSVIPTFDTATDTITDLLNVKHMPACRRIDVSLLGPDWRINPRSFCELNGGWTVNTFSSVNHNYEVDCRITVPVQQLLAASQTGNAIGFRQLLCTTSFDTFELEIAMNYSVHSRSPNASFSWDLTNRSVRFWIVFLTEYKVFSILGVLTDTQRTRSA